MKTHILAAFTSDHSPLIFSLNINQNELRGKVLWKFNNSLALNTDFVDQMKAHIANIQKNLDKEIIRDNQARWEYLKYEIRKFSIKFSKELSKYTKAHTLLLEKIQKSLECTTYLGNSEYITCKNKLDKLFDQKANATSKTWTQTLDMEPENP